MDTEQIDAGAGHYSAERRTVADWEEMQRLAHEEGWGDGLPTVPPTISKVEEHLRAAGLRPDTVIGEAPERNVVFRAEAVAINAVMAGARPEMMPILVAALEAVCDPAFKFNHLASLGSPWPMFLISGEEGSRLGLNHDQYLFGTDSPENAMLSRAFSLTMRNVAFARVGGIQRGQWGNPLRWQSFAAECPSSPWPSLRAELGFADDDSTLTAVSVYPAAPYQVSIVDLEPERLLRTVCHSIASYGGAQFTPGTYVVLFSPHHAEALHSRGWGPAEVREFIRDNTKTTVAELKRRGVWTWAMPETSDELLTVDPQDEFQEVFLFRSNGDLDERLWLPAAIKDRPRDLLTMVCGGDAGRRVAIAVPYIMSTRPVTRRIGA